MWLFIYSNYGSVLPSVEVVNMNHMGWGIGAKATSVLLI